MWLLLQHWRQHLSRVALPSQIVELKETVPHNIYEQILEMVDDTSWDLLS